MLLSSHTSLPDNLLAYWQEQKNICNDRNKDWFNKLLQDYNKYDLFTIITNKSDIVSFSLIQTHNFPEYTARIGTRTFIDPKYRNKTSSLEKNKETPIFQMLKEQYHWIKKNSVKENCFSSIEFGRSSAIKSCAKKFQQMLGVDAIVLPNLYKMFDNASHPSCFQSVILFPITSLKFDLPYINNK